jgi:ABC-type lipoprotein export system ATPase subunit
MAKFVGIVGPSGSGKSTSIKTLDPKTTYIINVASKDLPFRGASKLYNHEKQKLL